LSIAEDSSIEATDNSSDNISSAVVENILLARVVKYLVELELPLLLLVVYETPELILGDRKSHGLGKHTD